MAFTERYVTAAAGGGGSGTSGSPWTLAEAFANAVAGDRVNILSDSAYSIGATTATNAGTQAAMIVYRGYESTIGDLETQGRNADGSLNTTNFPAITLTGQLQLAVANSLQNLNISGALSSTLLGNTTADWWNIVSCSVTNSQNNASARAVQFDNGCVAINSDFYCSGAAHSAVVDSDAATAFIGCRFRGTESSEVLLSTESGCSVIGCVFMGSHLAVSLQNNNDTCVFVGNTFYGNSTGIAFANAALGALMHFPVLVNNHATDCTKWIDNLYSGTSNLNLIEVHTRTRDNTTPRTGVGDGFNVGEVTTDTGGAETDYTDAANRNFRLISGAPGVSAGLIAYEDIGAYQQQPSSGGGLLSGRGMTGGING